MRRAPRAVRRGRKFKSRPTSHDGLSVIFASGNVAGYTLDGKVAGRVGNNKVVCRDGTELSVMAGVGFHCLPKVEILPQAFVRPLQPHQRRPDYRGPYFEVEVAFDNVERRVLAPFPPTMQVMRLSTRAVRTLIEVHGGFARMEQMSVMRKRAHRQGAQEMARHLSAMAREVHEKANKQLVTLTVLTASAQAGQDDG